MNTKTAHWKRLLIILTAELIKALRTLGCTYKKKQKTYKEKDESKRVIERIRTEDKEKLVYVDETGIDTYLYRERARAPMGQKIIGVVSGRKFARQSIVAAKCGFGTVRIQLNLRYKVVQFLDKRKIASRTKTRANRYYGQYINLTKQDS